MAEASLPPPGMLGRPDERGTSGLAIKNLQLVTKHRDLDVFVDWK